MTVHRTPGVYLEHVVPPPQPVLLTGVPVFLGYADEATVEEHEVLGVPQRLTLWPQFEERFGPPPRKGGYLGPAVRGFFENGGSLCYVVALQDGDAPLDELIDGLAAVADLDAADLVCAPDVMRGADPNEEPDPDRFAPLQQAILDDCRTTGGRFAILDAVLTSEKETVKTQRGKLTGDDGALYHPWLRITDLAGKPAHVPPCGHVAGAYARSDQRVGVHKAPANEVIEGALDVRVDLDPAMVAELYERGVNCLRALPGRGIRVWGARTLSDDAAWPHVGGRRVLLTVGRWLERFMTGLAHEPNDVRLWVRISREVAAYLDGLFARGALEGRAPEEAFFVKCDGETNPPEVRAAGQVVTQVGLALAAPAEFVVVRVIAGASGVSVSPAP
ncbi:MAG TPA: phage tail sheath subtilisin-like domain-containing protein [Actinomycetes bacterium]|nr:phage tail sheath subtilisin-like domain-containing protein [Actinomycetes bacterium]